MRNCNFERDCGPGSRTWKTWTLLRTSRCSLFTPRMIAACVMLCMNLCFYLFNVWNFNYRGLFIIYTLSVERADFIWAEQNLQTLCPTESRTNFLFIACLCECGCKRGVENCIVKLLMESHCRVINYVQSMEFDRKFAPAPKPLNRFKFIFHNRNVILFAIFDAKLTDFILLRKFL